MTLDNAPIIGRQVSKVLKFEEFVYKGVLLWSLLHIRALVSLFTLLKLGNWLHKLNSDCYWVKFRYDLLQHFLFECGISGKEEKECVNIGVKGLNTPECERYNAMLGMALLKALDMLIVKIAIKELTYLRSFALIVFNCGIQQLVVDDGTIMEVSSKLKQEVLVIGRWGLLVVDVAPMLQLWW